MCISAVIVNYYTSDLLPPLIQSLDYSPKVREIIILDNSSELNKSSVKFNSPKVKIIINQENIGFAKAVNQSVEAANFDYILLANPDLRLFDGCIDYLLMGAREYEAPVVGPRFYWDETRIFKLPPATGLCWWQEVAFQTAGQSKLDAELLSFYWTIRHDRFWAEDEPFLEPFLPGACLLISKKWLEDKGEKLFDERFFLYFEDTDLCAKAFMEDVYPLCIPKAEAVHYWDQSPDVKKNDYMAESAQKFLMKYYKAIPKCCSLQTEKLAAYHDLGIITTAPTFTWNKTAQAENLYLEFGLNPYLVPFAQTKVEGSSFTFPYPIWKRLSGGVYFCRIRSSVYGTLRLWRWEKN